MRSLFTVPFRKYATTSEGTTEKVITKEIKGKDGLTIIEKINIIQKWSKMSTIQKLLLGSYGSSIIASFSFSTYHDGRDALIKRREERVKNTQKNIDNIAEDDWRAAKYGCTQNIGSNFIESVFFPIMWTARVIPKLVLFLNPPKYMSGGVSEEQNE